MSESFPSAIATESRVAPSSDLILEPAELDEYSTGSKIEGMTQAEVDAAAAELESALSIVVEYANEIVVCERLGGAEMTLGAAVNAIWPPEATGAMIKEGVGSVRAEIERMLATAKETQEEKLEEVGVEEELEEAVEEARANIVEDKKQKNDIQESKAKPELVAIENEKTQEAQNLAELEAEVNQPGQIEEVAAIDGSKPTPPANQKNTDKAARDAVQPEAFTAELKTTHANQEAAEEPVVTGNLNSTVEPAVVEHEAAKKIDQALESQKTRSDPEILAPEVDLQINLEAEIEADQAEVYKFASFIEGEEVWIEHFGEPEDERIEDPILVAEDGVFEFEKLQENFLSMEVEVRTERPEQLVETAAMIEAVQEPFTQLVEKIESSEPEEIEIANEIINKIIEVPIRLESQTEELISEEQAEAELIELYEELFEYMQIEYTPELVEALVKLTLKWNLIDEIKKTKKEEGDELRAQDGTHEIIKKIIVMLSKIKKAIMHAGRIGRSAMRLYFFGFSAQPA
ncbi:MAG TPA: hypothetical protein VFT49_03775 [Candidatus Saccharimonadales bacterium]|nr:hypothetical protein [Candidatus Saccharimonadales bacterium]